MTGTTHYTRTAIALHWIVAVLIALAFGIGLYAVGIEVSPQKLKLYSWHKWLGVTVFLLAAARLAWRAWHAAPAPLATLRPWERRLAGATHALLYVLLLAVPVTGWLMSSAAGFPVVYLGAVQLPDLVGKNKELGETLKTVHFVLNKTMLALVGLHIAAALKHHYVDRDNTLRRMLTRRA
jgi:cytochrome b561